MSISRKTLIFAVSLLIAVGVISLAYHVVTYSMDLQRNTFSQVSNLTEEWIDPAFLALDGTSELGSSILAIISEYPDYDYQIITKMCIKGFDADSVSNEETSAFYVNPTTKYFIKFVYDGGRRLHKILVVQDGCKVDTKIPDSESDGGYIDVAKQEAYLFYAQKQYSLLKSKEFVIDVLNQGNDLDAIVNMLQREISSTEAQIKQQESQILSAE